ncbi:DUF452 family protein [Suttonella sp. R2A3]|uniref:pimeloyl-ACP methyl esterase BioG family protein n=1 Tax=Suttonella sp. R2A3 TaxID=2908648 RepID=UPI001F3D1C4C|nr:pimeloyl-ACP methyl esterase BioG family protein [Suttonella sp. R2A3]UJF25432.1 DUF452 family protein [Suttonella sp. R2A3]
MKEAVLVFNGWGMDDRAIEHLCDGRRVLLIAPQTPLQTIATMINAWGERETHIIAWSMGVWAANRFLSMYSDALLVKKAIAINGTPPGIDDDYGIPLAVFERMVAAFNQQQRNKLYRRIFSLPHWRDDDYSAYLPQCAISEQHHALTVLLQASATPYDTYAAWSHAWISEMDSVVPSLHQHRYWRERGVCLQTKAAPHHLLRNWSSWADFLHDCP